MPPSVSEELNVICKQVALLERYMHELYCLSPQPTPELSGDLEKIISSTAPHFFNMVRMLLVDAIYLGIAKLLEPAEQGHGKSKRSNLTLEKLITEYTSAGSSQQILSEKRLKDLNDMFNQGFLVRNKILAHTDYNCSINYDDIIQGMTIDQDTLGRVVVKIRSIINGLQTPNTLPEKLPKHDNNWLGAMAIIDCLRPTVKP
jgi:hypothetical protein